jgi:peroxiredoxin
MKSSLTWIFAAVAVAIAVLVLYAYFAGNDRPVSGPASLAGRPAPSFSVVATSGQPAALRDYRGKIVVMNLWASWCPPCRAEMPDLQRLYQLQRSRGLVVLGVDQGEAPARAASFARSLGVSYPIFADEQQQYGRVYAALGLPTTIVVDRRGTVVQGFDGALTFDQMNAAVAPLLKPQ